jgi:hypothetical protein
MQVARHACPSHAPKIQPDIEPFRMDGLFERGDHLGDGLDEALLDVGRELVEASDVFSWGNQEMSIVVGKEVQQSDNVLGAEDDMARPLVRIDGGLTEKAAGVGILQEAQSGAFGPWLVFVAHDVAHPPGGPKGIVSHVWGLRIVARVLVGCKSIPGRGLEQEMIGGVIGAVGRVA